MDSLSLEHQKELRELLALYDNLIEEIERDGLDKDNGKRLHDVYDTMTKLLGESYGDLPQVNN